jgi:hypothetical protein
LNVVVGWNRYTLKVSKGGFMMNLKLHTLLFATVGIMLSSCGTAATPVMLYADTANALVTIDEGFDQEVEYDYMVQGGQLRFQHSHFMDVQMSSELQNDWVEVREMLETIRETQRLQNQQRVLIKMEASIIRTLATIIETNEIVLSEASATALAEAQTSLDATKLAIQTTRNEIRTLLTELRTLMRSVNRPMMWDERLISDIKVVLTALLPLTESLATSISTILPSLQSIRDIFIDVIPSELSPITEDVLSALALFETQLTALNTLQDEIKTVRQDTRLLMKEIHDIVATMKANNETLSVADKAALALKRLAIEDAMDSLRTIGLENKETLNSLKEMMTFDNLDYVNETIASLILQGQERLAILLSIQNLFLEAVAILEA